VLPLFFCAFACFGAGLVLVGANQASLAASLSLDLAASGLLAWKKDVDPSIQSY
jgi:hypothetical protein